MKKLLIVAAGLFVLVACKNNKKEKPLAEGKPIELRADAVNVVKLTDTLMIAESTCESCGPEEESFEIDDSTGIIKLVDKITRESDTPKKPGSPSSINLVLIPQKKGSTTFKLYKIMGETTRSADSANFRSYTVEVK